MPLPIEITGIAGAAELHEWFGYWPNFHDAEIINLHLNRKGNSSMSVHTWEMTSEVDENGCFGLRKHIVVEFVLENVSGLNLSGFNHQNVVFDIGIEKTESGFRLNLGGCYGAEGTIEAEKISLRLTPGKPS